MPRTFVFAGQLTHLFNNRITTPRFSYMHEVVFLSSAGAAGLVHLDSGGGPNICASGPGSHGPILYYVVTLDVQHHSRPALGPMGRVRSVHDVPHVVQCVDVRPHGLRWVRHDQAHDVSHDVCVLVQFPYLRQGQVLRLQHLRRDPTWSALRCVVQQVALPRLRTGRRRVRLAEGDSKNNANPGRMRAFPPSPLPRFSRSRLDSVHAHVHVRTRAVGRERLRYACNGAPTPWSALPLFPHQ